MTKGAGAIRRRSARSNYAVAETRHSLLEWPGRQGIKLPSDPGGAAMLRASADSPRVIYIPLLSVRMERQPCAGDSSRYSVLGFRALDTIVPQRDTKHSRSTHPAVVRLRNWCLLGTASARPNAPVRSAMP